MPSHRELLQARVAEAEKEHLAASREEERLRLDLNTEREAIATLQSRYEAACLAMAQGIAKAEDPATLLAERDRRGHRAHGLQQLHAKALDTSQASSTRLAEAQKALQRESDREEYQRLSAVIDEAEKRRKSAQEALAAADAEVNRAVAAQKNFLNHLQYQGQNIFDLHAAGIIG